MLDVIGCVIMVMCISIVPLFFGAVVVSIIREGKRRKKAVLMEFSEFLDDVYDEDDEEVSNE